jgi:pimeloyl-ACP methyl ester carboxylesterase
VIVDGLEVVRHGPPDGRVLVFHVGTPNAPEAFPLLTDALDERGCQLVAYARPGYAGSPRREGRTVADAAADTAAILDALGLGRFVTIGWSGGGPHALACAALLPDRCEAAASLAGVAPFDADGLDFLAGMGAENVEEFGAAARSREELEAFLNRDAPGLAQITGEDVAAGLGDLVDDVDRRALTGEFAETMASMLRQALGLRPRSDHGARLDLAGRTRPDGPVRPRPVARGARPRRPCPPLRGRGPHLAGAAAPADPRRTGQPHRRLTRSAQPAAIRSSDISRTVCR